ncbi:MAG: PHP domain-containing protein [Clostridiales bacterium]|jgi:putative hydrolase|nr:PHP domain-containing protein [Clostridiales bacterium]
MLFYGDYHTHTRDSDGINTIEQNIAAASKKGLKEIAITDHGFRNMFCLTERKVKRQKTEIERCREKYKDVNILYGIEADLIGTDGRIDIKDNQFEYFDVVIAGFHPSAVPYGVKDYFFIDLTTYYSVLFTPPKSVIRRNTRSAIAMLERYDIDIFPHINHSFYVDIDEVAKACADTGTYLELNEKHIDYTTFERLFKSEAKLIAGTDAHTSKKIGNFEGIERFVRDNGFDIGRIANFGGAVSFKKHKK